MTEIKRGRSMFNYIVSVIVWFFIALVAVIATTNFNIYAAILVFSLLAAAVTVAYGKMSEKLTNMERSIEELKEMLKEKE